MRGNWNHRVLLNLGVAGACAVAAGAAAAHELPPDLLRCAGERADQARLSCYDREVARALAASASAEKRAAQSSAASDPFAVRAGTKPPPTANSSGSPPVPSKLVSKILRVTERSDGKLSLDLENGQTWEQTERKADFVASAGETATIEKGALGSLWLSVGSHRATRVRRIR